jgi:hypothetical protein
MDVIRMKVTLPAHVVLVNGQGPACRDLRRDLVVAGLGVQGPV